MKIVGLILAGGEGRRLGGVRKAHLRLGNRALLDWVSPALEGQCGSIVVSSGPGGVSLAPDLVSVPDADNGITGPAAGLLAGALWVREHAPGSLMLSVSVDTPFWPEDFAARATPLLTGDTHCVVSAFKDRDYPTNALWRPDPLIKHLAGIPPAPRGPRIRDIQAALGARRLDYAQVSADNPFVGVNDLGDLLAFSRRLADMDA
jgi:molybdopterin-guanine dinucleotide biosynthesis protein A